MAPKLFLYTRIDDRRSWWWTYAEVLEYTRRLGIEVAAVVPIHRVRRWGYPIKELTGLPSNIELWLWIGGARDDAINKIIDRFGGLKQFLEVVKQSFDGVAGIDYTVYLDECSEDDSRRVADAARQLLEVAKAIGIDVVPQVRVCRVRDLVFFRGLNTDSFLYNAIHDLRDGFEKHVAETLSMLKNLGYGIWVAISGYDREYTFLKRLTEQGIEIDGVLTGIRCEHFKWIRSKYTRCVLDTVSKALEVLEH